MANIISNPSGDRQDKIANAAKVLGRSQDRIKVFLAVYKGKRKYKTISDIMKITRMSRVRVNQEAHRLDSENIIEPSPAKIKGKNAYTKIPFYTHNKNQILSLAKNKQKLKIFPTKSNPLIYGPAIKISLPIKAYKIKRITIDDIDSFSRVRRIKPGEVKDSLMYERIFKNGMKRLLKETGSFVDWGGETNDLFSTRILLRKKRLAVAFQFKGRGTKGRLIPKYMGKNADQIQRLFTSPADVHIIQYCGQIDESIIKQLEAFATFKSAHEMRTIYFGVIDGIDTARLIKAYPKEFKSK